jgi:multidrug efflux pump
MFGFSINTLTLLAMVLAIGLVVDDAIVVLENIYRHIEDGMKPFEAALKGIARDRLRRRRHDADAGRGLCAGRLHDRPHRRLFTEFALTLAGAVIVSGFVALTLSPMMCSKLLRTRAARLVYRASSAAGTRLTERLPRLSARCGMRRGWCCWCSLRSRRFAVALPQLPSELSPVEDRGEVIGFGIAPEGATLGYTDDYAGDRGASTEAGPEVERASW